MPGPIRINKKTTSKDYIKALMNKAEGAPAANYEKAVSNAHSEVIGDLFEPKEAYDASIEKNKDRIAALRLKKK